LVIRPSMYRNRPLFSLTFLTLGIALSLMLIPNAFAALGVVKLGWDPNSEPSVAGYKVKMGTASGIYGTVIDVGNKTSHNVPDLTVGTTYFFVVVAYNFFGLESDPSPWKKISRSRSH
jgi:Fibronectin type III domain